MSQITRKLLSCQALETNALSKGSGIKRSGPTAKTPAEMAIDNENWWCLWLLLAEGVDTQIPSSFSDQKSILEIVKASMSMFDERNEARVHRRKLLKQNRYKDRQWPLCHENR